MRPRRGSVVAASLIAGVGLAASLPPWGFWPLGFVGAGVLYWRLAGLRLRARLLAGMCAGLGCYVPGLFWARSFNWYGALILMIVEAASMAVAAALVPPRRGRLVAMVGAFTLLEAVRMTWPFGGLPIGGVFLGQADGPFLVAARVGGPLLLTALVWAGGSALGQAAIVIWRQLRDNGGGTSVWRGVPSTLIVIALVVGTAAASRVAPDGGRAAKSLMVAAIQGGGPRGFGNEESTPNSVYAAQLNATYAMEARDNNHEVRLVVWPEDVIALSGPLAHSSAELTMSTLSRQLRATVVAGVTTPAPHNGFDNEIVAWGPSGRIVGIFEKVHRVPFGEYVPYRSFFAHFANLSAVPLDAVPGHGSGLLSTPAAPLGILVSYEVFYANRSRPSVNRGAELLVVSTNTASYATSQVPTQEVAADEVQAVEEGRDLVQAATTGFSTVVNHDGVLEQRSGLGNSQYVLATVGLRTGRTIYARVGDHPVLVVSGLLVLAGLLLAWRERRAEPGVGEEAGSGDEVVAPAAANPPLPPVVGDQPGFQAPSLGDVTGERAPPIPQS